LSSSLIQEETGVRVGISANVTGTAQHAASILEEKYRHWLESDKNRSRSTYKRNHFTIAVGGGNTIKVQYQAWLDYHHKDIDWLKHVRFFFLEESCGEPGWESAESSLIINFIKPLANKLIQEKGIRKIAGMLELTLPADKNDIIDAMIALMVNPINMTEVKLALKDNKKALAMKLARAECERYQRDIQHTLGRLMDFDMIISGIGKDGTIGAFSPYRPELAVTEPCVAVLKQDSGALRIALNRGVLTNADCISLMVSGNLKLMALGRFEMDEAADFEQTVMETPLRMLRETREIAEKVYIFADEQALHFDETVFEYQDKGSVIQHKAETREGKEENGIHILLMHGFMGLFSFTSLLIRLPSAWSVSALHRGRHAKFLENEEIFPHYARSLRKMILKNWRKGRPSPIAGHSIAGSIIDHLLLSLLDDYDADIPAYKNLKAEDKQLVDALRAGGIINLAAWAPTDGLHAGENIKTALAHYRRHEPLDYTGFDKIYDEDASNKLQPLHSEALAQSRDSMAALDRFLDRMMARPLISSMNGALRLLLNSRTVQHQLLNVDLPYVMRLVGGRLLKTVSLYGLAKEINAALHNPVEFQKAHLKALDIIIAYDIPYLSLIHQDDFLVSTTRHSEEHQYLLAARMNKEKVNREDDLKIPARFVVLQRAQDELPVDPLNPHLLIMATSNEGNVMAREITAAISQFVNENVARAIRRRAVKSLPSVRQWVNKHAPADTDKSTGPHRPGAKSAGRPAG
jgi:6-phosphogluconolactonase/glucosamine-6-phosphate isomerase/deaminase